MILTAKEESAIRLYHEPSRLGIPGGQRCKMCWESWPCRQIAMLDALDAERARADAAEAHAARLAVKYRKAREAVAAYRALDAKQEV